MKTTKIVAVVLIAGLMAGGCGRNRGKETAAGSDSTAGSAYDTSLSPQSKPVIVRLITWPIH